MNIAVRIYAGTSCPAGYNDDDEIEAIVQREHLRQVNDILRVYLREFG